MDKRNYRFSLTQLFLMTALCALAAGLVATAGRQTSHRNIHSIEFSPNGDLLVVTGTPNGNLEMWNYETGQKTVPLALRPRIAEEPQGVAVQNAVDVFPGVAGVLQ